MSDSTSILELPTDPAGGNHNVSISATEQQQPQSSISNSNPVTLDQSIISQIVSGLQQASSTGITQLPSRDIPQNTESITRDPQIQANYIPPVVNQGNQNRDYIQNNEQMESMIEEYNKKQNKMDSLDEIYSEIQNPLLLAVLYFLFQLPVFRKFFFSYFPVLFYKDGNYNIQGHLFMSILFGLLFYLLVKLSVFFNTF